MRTPLSTRGGGSKITLESVISSHNRHCSSFISASKSSSGSTKPSTSSHRWAWQAMPILSLPSVQTETVTNLPQTSKHRPTSLATRVENRVVKVKKSDGGVADVIKKAEQILRDRRREHVGRWASTRNFIRENRCCTAGPPCCRRKRDLESSQSAATLRAHRRDMAIIAKDAKQRLLIAEKATANREVKARKIARDMVFAELVYKRIFIRTGGNARSWMVVLANVQSLLLFKHILEKEARRATEEMSKGRIATVSRFLLRVVDRRRRTKAANILAGALGALTNSNAIVRYARRVRWGSRHLQVVARQRAACTRAHLGALLLLWDRMFPPRPRPTPPSPHPSLAPGSSRTDSTDPNALVSNAQEAVVSSSAKNSNQQPSVRRSGKGVGASSGRARGRAKGKRVRVRKKAGDADDANVGESNTEAEGQWRKYVSHEDKTKEITSWLRWTREKHIREISLYERFTIFPHMVELLLQYEPSTYRTRWQALNHVNSLKVHGRLSKLWIEGGYHKLLANVIPPPPRMRRFFTAEEGEFIYKRALSRSVLADAECSSAGIGDGGGGSAKDDGGTEVLNRVSFPGAIDARAGTWSAWGQEDVGGDSRPEETAGKDQTNVET